MRIILTLLFILHLCTLYSNAQRTFNFGITGNGGVSKIGSLPENRARFEDLQYSFSGNWGLVVENQFMRNLSVGFEVLWVQIELFSSYTSYQYVDAPVNTEFFAKRSVERRLSSTYIGIPFYLKFHINKFRIKGGIQYMRLLNSNYADKHKAVYASGSFWERKSNLENINSRSYDLGPTIGIEYQLFRFLTIRADSYLGLKALNNDLRAQFHEGKNRQYTLGFNLLF